MRANVSVGSPDSGAVSNELIASAIAHPFTRYGLATALAIYAQGKRPPAISAGELKAALAKAIEAGLNKFRMETNDDPSIQESIRFRPIALDLLRKDGSLVAGKLAKRGKYLFPSVLTIDRQAKGTFEDAETVFKDLHEADVALTGSRYLKRSLVPVSGEINNGGGEKLKQRGSLFLLACAAAATVTPVKAAALAESAGESPVNSGIFPDLPLDELITFIRLFYRVQATADNLLVGRASNAKEFRRPPVHDGNYPGAPPSSTFNAVGLLAAIGYWSSNADDTTRGDIARTLNALQDATLYITSYSGFSQVTFSHYVVDLARNGNLRKVIFDFYFGAVLYAGLEYGKPVHYAPQGADSRSQALKALSIGYTHLYLKLNRFLQRFDEPSFRSFLAARAEYPNSTYSLLEAYFLQSNTTAIDIEIVQSARALGQWINRTAYKVADQETKKETLDRKGVVSRFKAKILIEFESAIMSATSPVDLLYRVSTRAGRFLLNDAPPESEKYFESTAAGVINLKQAQHLLIAFLRLRPKELAKVDADESQEEDYNEQE